MSKQGTRLGTLAVVLVAVLIAAGCNPLLGDPVSQGGELELTSARLVGSDPVWIELAVSGAGATDVYALGLVDAHQLHGPSSRQCATSTGAVPCTVTTQTVQMPDQRIVPGVDASSYVRLMQLWPGESITVALVCIGEDQELGCPDSTRTALAAVDEQGHRVGDLVPG